MKKIVFTIVLFCCYATSYAQQPADSTKKSHSVVDSTRQRFRVSFSDKNNSPYSLNNPEKFLSAKAIERRERFNIAITTQDLPVNPQYISAIAEYGAVCNSSKWFNSAVIITDSTNIESIKKLPFVTNIEKVASKMSFTEDRRKLLPQQDTVNLDFSTMKDLNIPSDYYNIYGKSFQQNALLGTFYSHKKGYTGQGMTIAVVDAGFLHVDSALVFKKIRDDNRLLLVRDVTGFNNCFNQNSSNIYKEGSHGMMVLSLIGGFIPNEIIGTAPQANFILIHSEEGDTEYIVEEDNWTAAAELADSAGADIISTSLGYSEFDDKSQNHSYSQMDGKTTRITLAADIAASKGMLLVNSAGNSGNEPWKYITAPADADSVITVGACNYNNKRVGFSSVGPTADNRIKPDIMALGLYPAIVTTTGEIKRTSGGTSFSCPLISGCCACLWQEFPDSSAQEIKKAIMRSGSRYNKPNNKYGYGTPSVQKARNYFYAKEFYAVLSEKYILPDFDDFFDKLWDAGIRLDNDFVFAIQKESNSFLVKNHNYDIFKNEKVIYNTEKNKLYIMASIKKSVSFKIKNKNYLTK